MSINLTGFKTNSVKVIAPAKINLHLEILGLRDDGFHELAMLMQSIDLCDQIELFKTNNGEINLTSNDSSLSTGDDNLIMRSAKLMRVLTQNEKLGAEIHLKKNIPIGAGLAGGSSDAAATLIGLNALWKLDFPLSKLEVIAAELGSDVPFCLAGGTQFCFGRGESLEKVNIDEKGQAMAVVLVKDPLVEVSTPWAYSKYREVHFDNYLKVEEDFKERQQLLRKADWINPLTPLNPPPLRNDLQQVVAPAIPAVENGLHFLSSLDGALSIAMSGSGPSCFALFADLESAKRALENNRNKLKTAGLKGWCCAFNVNGSELS
ncbi:MULTISPECIES: 4-(cytidine 5'-diphospho)-2-C-methyl-D-erythritol kinase [unclassified Prochlorococcus]|uniref:4-(cytidine 5'-diphospho)-2-C-methyl-D-erythritol kinase n=1 Tax=unclassified Prochlorococcus TaxID=2627481 RepID=UPI0005337099|nr:MULTISPECIES: 4-(cytidine 5'-diphospho)-2-C-methyl-D-erythritol kinase [unclassified Prochlorococcus]KGG15078.1 4-diphosphocytidyl-2-C-methyl-D-erythritol kinase [Prochlorococcus sp. MIT 0602]KGG17350.1 4-diphosphocytidyl-2-C-methyl-D-erythritol kinase [Prochlorococcus sp. MIT 0603]